MKYAKRFTAFFAVFALIVSLCGCSSVSSGTSSSSSPDDPSLSSSDEPAPGSKPFTLRYDPAVGLDPMSDDDTNFSVISLVFEPLFILSESFEPIPVLCENYKTEDGLTHIFSLRKGVKFHDGSEFKASDAVYSLNQAADSARFGQRFRYVSQVTASDEYTVSVTLSRADCSFAALLDFPVIKESSAGSPVGTGPFVLRSDSELAPFSGYRSDDVDIGTIKLGSFSDVSISAAVVEGSLSLYVCDMTSSGAVNINVDHEERDYDTTILQYVGINPNSGFFKNDAARKAVSMCIDRDRIVSSCMGGHAKASKLILSPALDFYDEFTAKGVGYSPYEAKTLFGSTGVLDLDDDGWFEYRGENGYEKLTVRFIVNSDNVRKSRAVSLISDTMRDIGVYVLVEVLAWDDYLKALEEGNFDLYYGEVRLTADFDLSPLFGGNLNYLRLTDEKYLKLTDEFLGADSYFKTFKARDLCRYVCERADIIPVLYKCRTVICTRSVISGITPGVSSPFGDITACRVKP